MRSWPAFLLFSLAAVTTNSWARGENSASPPVARQLSGIGPEEAATLLAKLQDAQRRLKTGEFQSFELSAGSIASYDETKISARDAFLRVPFEKVWNIERVRSENPLAQPFRLAYAPRGLGHLYWDIEVVLGINGGIQRVLMIYKPPAPF